MSRITRSRVLSALVVGIAAGLLAAVMIPRTHAEDPRSAVIVQELGPPHVAPARPARGEHESILKPDPSTVHLESRQPDPRGGPDWAVRVFQASTWAPAEGSYRGSKPRPRRCAQLGRVFDGRFGWIDAANTFRPVGFGYQGAPFTCGPPDARAGQIGLPALVTTLTATDAEARLRESVVWGVAGAGVQAIDVDVDGTPRAVPHGAQGGYLTIVPAALQKVQIGVMAVRDDGTRVDLDVPPPAMSRPRSAPRLPAWLRHDLGKPQPIPAVITARAPDPDGGLPWGLAAVPTTERGGWCTSMPARIVEGRVGDVDATLGTFVDASTRSCRLGELGPNAERPVDMAAELGGAAGGRPTPARIARRTQAGTTKVFGTALPTVETITVRTPRDVRTLVPTPPARAFLVVYDGSFPTGGPVLTALLRDGTTWNQRTGETPGPGG